MTILLSLDVRCAIVAEDLIFSTSIVKQSLLPYYSKAVIRTFATEALKHVKVALARLVVLS